MKNKNEFKTINLDKAEMNELNLDLEGAIKVLLEAGKEAELKDSTKSKFGTHEKVARKVFRRLLLRNAQLSLLTELTQRHFSSKQEFDEQDKSEQVAEKQNKTDKLQNKNNDPGLHAYKHAITDLFVEKALTYLEEKADYYSMFGRMAYYLGLGVITCGIGIAAFQYFNYSINIESFKNQTWGEIITRFILAFTFYGFIVLAAVGLWRFGRAMLDQAERLLERRHALRQGRLFVHLHDGEMSIEDMEKAFNWNVNKPNAFSDMNTEAKAPWGTAVTEVVKGSTEVAKAAKNISDNYSNKANN